MESWDSYHKWCLSSSLKAGEKCFHSNFDCEIRSQFCTYYDWVFNVTSMNIPIIFIIRIVKPERFLYIKIWCIYWWLSPSMMTSSNGNIFRVTGNLCREFTGEFPAQRPVTRSFDVFFDLGLIKPLSKQLWGWWFEMLSCPLWRHCNGLQ